MTGIHTEVYGSGKPLVLVHGWAMHSGVWLDFAKELAKNYKVICVDLPGHGRSEAIAPFNLENIGQDLAEAVQDKECFWLGWSLGALAVLQIAAGFPERADKLILLAGTPCFMAKEQWPGMDEKVLDNFAGGLMQDCRETLIRFLALQTQGLADQGEVLRRLKKTVLSEYLPSLETLEDGLQILKTTDLRNELAELRIPVAAILGRFDSLVPVEIVKPMQLLSPNLDVTVIERAGHVPFLTHGAETAEAVRRFLDR